MKTYVISGGTDGIGRAVALDRLAAGDQVVVIGRNEAKGAQALAEAQTMGAGDRVHVIVADLSLVAATRAAVTEVKARFSVVDGLVLCAQHFRSTRLVTVEGFEHTLALYYLSRYLLSHGLTEELEAAESPVVVNVCGPGVPMGEVRWDDLDRAEGYAGLDALMQGSRLNDLLGVGYLQQHPGTRVRYVLLNPGGVRTSFSGEYDEQMAGNIEAMRAAARPIEDGIVPVVKALTDPPQAPLSASMMGDPLPLEGPAFDPEDARRLTNLTRGLLSGCVA